MLAELALLSVLASGGGAGEASLLFAGDSVINARIEGPFGDLLAARDRRSLPFELTVHGMAHAVELRVRGKSRLRVCRHFPPLRVTFSPHDTAGTVFSGQRRLKLVTHCRRGKAAQTDVLQEYAAYKIFNLISDVGYRVRLLRLSYVDTGAGAKRTVLDRYGFLIESREALASRVGAEVAELDGVSLASMDEEQLARVFVFQYLIGNTDWSLVKTDGDDACCHNGELLQMGAKRFYVPHDFDLAGLVNASYAYPDSALRIRKVTQRLYRGFCISPEAVRGSLDAIVAREQAILDVARTLPGLGPKERASGVRYLSDFFARASQREELLAEFERRCL